MCSSTHNPISFTQPWPKALRTSIFIFGNIKRIYIFAVFHNVLSLCNYRPNPSYPILANLAIYIELI